MIAVTVSSRNHCLYCITSHGAAVREFSGDPVLGDILATNYRDANLSQTPPRDARLCLEINRDAVGWSATTESSPRCGQSRLLSDEDIFDITDVVAYFQLYQSHDRRPGYAAQSRVF